MAPPVGQDRAGKAGGRQGHRYLTLAGRTETLHLLPLSQAEIEGRHTNWLDSVFSGHLPGASPASVGADLVDRVLRGGHPEMRSRSTARRRTAWTGQSLEALIHRDVRDVADIGKLDA